MDAEEDHSGQPAIGEDLSLKNLSKPTRRRRVHCTPRVEVLSMWFEAAKNDKESFIDYIIDHRKHLQHVKEPFRNIIETDPAMFLGRVFLCDCFDCHEIYNSKSVKTLYTDLPMEKRAPKRKLEDCNISGHTDLLGTNEEQVQEDTTNGSKNNSNGNSVFSGDIEMLATNEEQVQQDTIVFPPSLAPDVSQNQASEKTFLPVMGPHVGILLSGDFVFAVHRDCGDALIDDLYTETDLKSYVMRAAPPYDDFDGVCQIKDKRLQLKVQGLYHSLIIDCIMFRDSKSVHVEVEWVMTDENNNATTDDIYICGEISVISEGTTSMLFQTPPDKAKKVTLGEHIPLLKSVFAVQYLSDFQVSASLCRPDNVKADCTFYFPSVKSSALFPHSEIDESAAYVDKDAASRYRGCELYDIKRHIPGSGGYLKVRAAIDIQ